MYHCPFILAPSHVPLHILDSVAQAMTIRLLIDEASYAALHGFSHLVPIPINTSKRMGQGVFAPKSRPLGSIYSVGNQFFSPPIAIPMLLLPSIALYQLQIIILCNCRPWIQCFPLTTMVPIVPYSFNRLNIFKPLFNWIKYS